MSKTEEKLIKSIKDGDKDNALELLAAFSELKNSTDEQSNIYFEQIEAIGIEEAEVEAVVVDDAIEGNEGSSEAEEVKEVAPRVEKRGVKAKPKERVSIEKSFDKLEADCIDYFAQVKRGDVTEARFAKRMVQRLRLIRKQVFKK